MLHGCDARVGIVGPTMRTSVSWVRPAGIPALDCCCSAAMGPQYGFKLEMCSYLDPLPADPLAAFADWTISHYGVRVGMACLVYRRF